MSDKMAFSHKEEAIEAENVIDLDKTRTVDIENYHGLTAKTVLVYMVRQTPDLRFIQFNMLTVI